MTAVSAAGRIRALRGPKEPVDAWRPIAVLNESERTADGAVAQCLTVFLAGAECPFTCRFCDLWVRTLEGPTPAGALPAQLEAALEQAGSIPDGARLKLYNASNFFEPRAVPPGDLERIVELSASFERVVVECHPRLVGPAAVEFGEALAGGLEVAMGLETVHPRVLPRLNKEMTLADYDRAAGFLAQAGITQRVFVLIGVPWVAPRESVDWAVVSAAYALDRGAETVTLIPLRPGNGELDRLAEAGSFRPAALADIEDALDRSLALAADGSGAVVQLDLWDLARFSSCPECEDARAARLARLNASGETEPRVSCAACEVCGDG